MPEEPEVKSTIKEIEVDGFKFTVDTERLDDVEAFEYIDLIENKGKPAAIVSLLSLIIGKKAFDEMKAHYVKRDGVFKASKLPDIYTAIISAFDPKS